MSKRKNQKQPPRDTLALVSAELERAINNAAIGKRSADKYGAEPGDAFKRGLDYGYESGLKRALEIVKWEIHLREARVTGCYRLDEGGGGMNLKCAIQVDGVKIEGRIVYGHFFPGSEGKDAPFIPHLIADSKGTEYQPLDIDGKNWCVASDSYMKGIDLIRKQAKAAGNGQASDALSEMRQRLEQLLCAANSTRNESELAAIFAEGDVIGAAIDIRRRLVKFLQGVVP